jgi:hypothetical protein
MSADGDAKQKGLSSDAGQELRDAGGDECGDQSPDCGADKYLGTSSALPTPFGVWTQHTFVDPNTRQPNGPVCIAGTPYAVFTKAGDPDKLLIFLQGGGACWQDFYNCNILALSVPGVGNGQEPPKNPPFPGIFDSDNPDNPFADYSIVYMPYCDGSAFGGDNDVVDLPDENGEGGFPFGPVRFHRGVRNLSAGMDVAAATFPRPKKITVAGSSAGGVGAAAFAPFLARFKYGNRTDLTVFNDAGPIVVNLGATVGVQARDADWDFAKFYPESCTECSAFGQQTAIVDWRLENDSTIREAFYETDADGTNRFFAQSNFTTPFVLGSFTPLTGLSPTQYRELILEGTSFDASGNPIGMRDTHDALNDAHRKRYKRFIVAGDSSHTALGSDDKFYNQEANGVLLNEWTREFILDGDGDSQFGWKDIVEDPVP